MMRHNIPTAAYAEFTSETVREGEAFLEQSKAPYVLKADGLAAGKGVLIIDDLATAKRELREMLLESKFGAASNKVVIEEFLAGIELSCFVLTDGSSYLTLPMAIRLQTNWRGRYGPQYRRYGSYFSSPLLDR